MGEQLNLLAYQPKEKPPEDAMDRLLALCDDREGMIYLYGDGDVRQFRTHSSTDCGPCAINASEAEQMLTSLKYRRHCLHHGTSGSAVVWVRHGDLDDKSVG